MLALLTRLVFALIAALLMLLCNVAVDITGRAASVSARALPSSIIDAPVRKSDDDVSLEDLGKIKRGKEHVLVVGQAGGAGLVCKLKLKYGDGNADSPDDVISDKDGVCVMFFDVPDRKSVAGDAIAKLRVETTKGKFKGKTSQGFTVKP
jgi:hypothetical protein